MNPKLGLLLADERLGSHSANGGRDGGSGTSLAPGWFICRDDASTRPISKESCEASNSLIIRD